MKLLKLLTMTSRLANLQRFSMERLSHPESVLEHTGFVAMIAFVLASEIEDLDVGIVLMNALIHDLDEVIVGDVARPTKYATPEAKQMFDDLAVRGVRRVASDLYEDFPCFAGHIANNYQVAKIGREGLIVAIADVLAVVHTVWSEVIVRNNHAMLRQAYTAEDQIGKLRARVAETFHDGYAAFLNSVLDDASDLMIAAQDRDDPVYATMMEEPSRAN